MENNLGELNSILFDTLRSVKEGKMDEKKAQTIVNVGNSIINNAKTQLSAFKVTNGKTDVGTFGKLQIKPSAEGSVFDNQLEYSISIGYDSVAKAMDGEGKFEFKEGFNSWMKENKE